MRATVLITGSRDFGSAQQDQRARSLYDLKAKRMIETLLDKYINAENHTLVAGGARGADDIALKWALANETTITVVPARWSKFGRGAGLTRNENMLLEHGVNLVIAFWNGRSKGTKHMIEFADRRGVRTMVFKLDMDWLAENTAPPEPKANY
jgi:hypothetical protein